MRLPAELLGGVLGDLPVIRGQHMVLKLDNPDADIGHQVRVDLSEVVNYHIMQLSCHLDSCGTAANYHK